MTIPHTRPAVWPKPLSPGRFAGTIHTGLAVGCRVALIGLPDDTGVRLNHGRAGAAEGPRAFREALSKFGVADPHGFSWPRVFDAGDVDPAAGHTEAALHETHRRVSEAASALLDLGLIPVAVGGGHDLTFPFVRAAAARYKPLAGIYADAHLDVRETVGSGMPFRRLIEDCRVGPVWAHGVHEFANSAEHALWFLTNGGRIVDDAHATDRETDLTPTLTERDAGHDLFVSFDLDVIDAAFAPGVSAMNPRGWSPRRAERFVRAAGRHPRVRCFDLMELSPPHDDQGRTARVAAFLFLTFLRGLAERPA